MTSKHSEAGIDVRHITAEQLFHLGVQNIAYVKTVSGEGEPRYVVHTAEGAELGVFADREVAFAAIRQHDMEPLSLH
jgi:hypothetical protein